MVQCVWFSLNNQKMRGWIRQPVYLDLIIWADLTATWNDTIFPDFLHSNSYKSVHYAQIDE